MFRSIPACLITVLISTASFGEDLAALLNYVPREANALMTIDVKAMLASPMADKEGWKKRVSEETVLGLLPMPEMAEYVVVAEQLQPGSLQGKWELVLISTGKSFSLPDIAKAEKSHVETISSSPACFTRRNTVIVQLSPTLLGVFSPAHRQDVARWLKAQSGKPVLSKTLARASDLIKEGNQAALIFDLEDTLEAGKVKQFVATQKAVQDKKLDIDALSKAFSSLSSVQITIKTDQQINAVLRATYEQELGSFTELMPGLTINALDGIGADMEEFRKGNTTTSARAFEIRTSLSAAGMKSTLGLLQPHSVAAPMAKKANKPEEDDPGKESQKAFRSIQSIANTAHDQAEKSQNIARAMVIYDNAATRIDKLPVAQADPEIQQFAMDVARTLRDIATALHTGVLEVQSLESKIRTNVNVTQVPSSVLLPNPWGIRFWNPIVPYVPQYNVQSNQEEIIAAQTEAINKAVRKRNELWKQLVEKSVSLKKALSTKYGLPF